MQCIKDLPTPVLLVEQHRVERNISKMKDKANLHGVALRAHLKTAKSADIAMLLVDDEHRGITVSTLKEASFFAEHGYQDILYAVGIEPRKFQQLKSLDLQGVSIKVVLDSLTVAEELATWTSQHHCQVSCLIEIDSDGSRAGILPDSDELIAIANTLHNAESIHFLGVMTHAGSSYQCHSIDAIKAVAEKERSQCVAAANRIQESGIPCEIVSIGSTPTIAISEDFSGVTEVRPGVFVFFDLFQHGLQICAIEDIAVSVLATVTGHSRHSQKMFIDAGALALSKDRGTQSQAVDYGYGLVCDINGCPIDPLLIVNSVHQEHGVIENCTEATFAAHPIGSSVRILPNHACMTAAAYNHYYVVNQQDVVALWSRCNGWA